MKDFLEKKIEKKPGNIIDTAGNILGEHEGAFSYTIGQRRGIKVGGGPALFVVARDVVANTVTVGTEADLALFSSSRTGSEQLQRSDTNTEPRYDTDKKTKSVSEQ
jgi:tRNA U34 2-thiouridine synthase MnmA/TrmU